MYSALYTILLHKSKGYPGRGTFSFRRKGKNWRQIQPSYYYYYYYYYYFNPWYSVPKGA